MRKQRALRARLLLATAAILIPVSANAQRREMRRLVPTTLVIGKPATAPDPRDPHAIWLGVGPDTYGFQLRDAYTDVADGDVAWSGIWQTARPFRPNFHVIGPHADAIAKIKTGETVIIRGMYSAQNRTLEVTGIAPNDASTPARY